ncbi:MAG: MATE family efflux transporter [Treponema sp.]|nr:MATE family efflux transporter [Treponema sp.]
MEASGCGECKNPVPRVSGPPDKQAAGLSMMERWNGKALFRLIWPLVIEQVLAVTMGMADTVMISSVGEYAISAVNIVDNINNLLIIAFAALATGGAVVVSQYIGRRDHRNAGEAAKQLLYAVSIISLVICVFAFFFRRPIIRLIYGNVDAGVMEAASLYMMITCLSYPFLAIYNADAALFRAVGNSGVTMKIALLVNVLNIGGNAFLIFVLRWGVMGAGLSTLISRMLAAVITLVLLRRGHGRPIRLARLSTFRFIRPMFRSILNVGIPSGLESSMFMVGRLLTQRIFPMFGLAAMAGNTVAGVVNSFSFMPGSACGMALLTIVGQCVGAGDYGAAKKHCARVMKITYAITAALSFLTWIFRGPLIGIFNLSPEAYKFGSVFLELHCISMILAWPMSFALPNALRAAGDSRYVMWVATISMWTVRVSMAYIFTFALGLGPLGVWLAMGCDFISRGGFYLGRWLRGRWQEMHVIE